MTDWDDRLNLVFRAASIACLVMAMFVALSGAATTRAALNRDADSAAPGAISPAKSV